NTYLYAPKDDPYHRKQWRQPYPNAQWRRLLALIRAAQKNHIDFVYGFHPGEGLYFSDDRAVKILLRKARRFYDAGVRTFALLFDDIPSRLSDPRDQRAFKNSLARAEATWMAKIIAAQPASWGAVEWWICPSYYSEDGLLERVFGRFEPEFLEILTYYLPPKIPCFWTGPSVVSKSITLAHVRRIAKKIKRPLLLWDNYPVNDLSMRDELHIGPLTGRDPRLPQAVYGYLNNPLLQEELSFIPLATCFDYAHAPARYRAESSWTKIVRQRFGAEALPHWRALRSYAEASIAAKKAKRALQLTPAETRRLQAANAYLESNRGRLWSRELAPWRTTILKLISDL
ncbi:MAG TPA: beta-N-acetylglucosaminidase domain-containing protein, partial [Candidatus Limnocylindria bacterium]|nr:beta-N-acetylglucosaminidase domain-containing protein [Candidatus Limnocylindria bacterium]